jgi:alanyl-tRNA synthetase
MEIGNSVFMQYQKQADGTLKELDQRNVDFGGGLERLNAAVNNTPDVFKTDSFSSIIALIEKAAGITYGEKVEETRALRIMADHLRAAIMIMSESIAPSNKGQGYLVRRLIRRSVLYGKKLGFWGNWEYLDQIVGAVVSMYEEAYPEVKAKQKDIEAMLRDEALRFSKTVTQGLREIEKMTDIDGKKAFYVYESFGFPWELTEEIAKERGFAIDRAQFESEFKEHQNVSRSAAKGMFKGGLADHSEQTTKLHTTHHLLLAALQKIVDPSIHQRGSNITGERLRIDFNLDRKLTDEELQKVVALVNEKIQEKLEVKRVEMPIEKAKSVGAQMEFGAKYPDVVSVYFVGLKSNVDPEEARPGDYYSAEFCGGPHVENTGVIGTFSIAKEESAGSGIRRIYGKIA